MNVGPCRNFGGFVGELGLGIFLDVPSPVIDRFRHTKIERQLLNYLPFEAQIGAATKAVGRRNGKGIEHVVLIDINAVVPVASVEELNSEPQRYWTLDI